MAKVDPNSTLGGVRGSVAGMVISSGLSGWNARTAVTPLRSRSFSQATRRLYLAQIAAHWKTLSPSEREDWADAAALTAWKRQDWFGNDYSMGGYGLFVSLMMPLVMLGLSMYDTPPAATFPDPVEFDSAYLYRDGDDVDAQATFTAAPNTSAAYCRLWLSVAALGSSAPLANRRALDVIGAAPSSTTLTFWTGAEERFGLPLLLQRWTLFFATFDAYGRSSAVSSLTVGVLSGP